MGGDDTRDVMECSTDEVSTSECDECDSRSPSVERTASQTSAQMQIEGVSERIEERKVTVQKLLKSIADLSCEGVVQTLQECEKLLDSAKKQARNLGEDLLEDLLALDGLSGLIPEDRNRRKAAIADINLLLEEVDASKVRLAALQKQLQTALDAEKNRQREAEAVDPRPDAQEMREMGCPEDPHRPIDRSSEAEALPSHRGLGEQRLSAPVGAIWKGLQRPVDFQVRQERGNYVLLAALPGLSTEELAIDLSDDESALRVAGLCVPSAHQTDQMRKQLLVQLQRLARTSPQRFKELSSKLEKVAMEAYKDLGRGRFGSFSETFQVPSDVDLHNIRYSFEDGVLRITLPRRSWRESRPMTARHPYGHQLRAGLWGHPAFGL